MPQSVSTQGKQAQNFQKWDITQAYLTGDCVIYSGSAYIAISDIAANTAWSTSLWTLVVLGTTNASIVQITAGGLSTALFRTSDGKIYGATGNNAPRPGACRYTDLTSVVNAGIPNMQPIHFYDSTLSYEETGKATYVGIQGLTAYVLFDSGNLWGWGYNGLGQLGIGNNTDQYYPRRLATGVARVFAGQNQAHRGRNAESYTRGLYLGTNGKLYGCGWCGQGGLGLGTGDLNVWTEMPWAQGSNGIRNVWNVGAYGGCVVVETNEGGNLSKYRMVGYNADIKLGNGSTSDITNGATSSDVTSAWTGSATTTWRIKDVQAGIGYWDSDSSVWNVGVLMLWIQDSVVTTNSKVKTAGNYNWGLVGNGSNSNANTSSPYTVVLGGQSTYDVKQIQMTGGIPGNAHALLTNGNLYGWGDNRYGQIGDGTTTLRNAPVASNTNVKELVCPFTAYYNDYYTMTMMRKNDGSYWACGLGDNGQTGTGDPAQARGSWYRMMIPAARNWACWGYIDTGSGGEQYVNPIMYDQDGILWSWGYSGRRTMGNQAYNSAYYYVPTVVNPPNL